MKNALFLILAALMPVPAFASGATSALDGLKFSARDYAVPAELKAPEPAAAPMPPAVLKWDYDGRALARPGQWTFDWGKKRYAIKLLFRRGDYDPYVKTFKASPHICLQDITDLEQTGAAITWGYQELDTLESVDFYFEHEGKDEYLRATRDGNTLAVSECDAKDKCSQLTSFAVRALYADWETLARERAILVSGRKVFLVPQSLFDGERWSYGYVISENNPLYFTTGRPQDYVELFREGNDGFLDFRPTIYSLPTKLVFEIQPPTEGSSAPAWTVREMEETEIQDALKDMLANRAKGPAVPGRASVPAVAK